MRLSCLSEGRIYNFITRIIATLWFESLYLHHQAKCDQNDTKCYIQKKS